MLVGGELALDLVHQLEMQIEQPAQEAVDEEDWHGQVERYLSASGIPAVILQSSFYMSNLFADAERIARDGRIVAPASGAQIAMIDPRDVGAAAAAAVTGSGHDGQTYLITGSEAITYEQVAAALSAATGRHVRFVDVPEEAARQAMLDAGLPEFVAGQLVKLYEMLRQGVAAEVTRTVELLTGKPPRTFATFARDHAQVFEPSPVAAGTERVG